MKLNDLFKKKTLADYITYSAILTVGIFIDQLTKWLVVKNMEMYEHIPVIKFGDSNIASLYRTINDGAAFGMLDDHRWVFLVLSTVMIIALIYYICKYKPKSKWVMTSLILIVGGGIGNMIDRVLLGYVIDFIDFCAFPNLWKWVFNIADSCVCVGTFMLSLWLIIDTVKAYKLEKAEKEKAE
jgi:signal peptidase II